MADTTIDTTRDELARMDVRIVSDDGGWHVEPPLDETWPVRERLRWLAGCVNARTGVDVQVIGYSTNWCVAVPGISVGLSGDWHEVWTFLNGVELGADAAPHTDACERLQRLTAGVGALADHPHAVLNVDDGSGAEVKFGAVFVDSLRDLLDGDTFALDRARPVGSPEVASGLGARSVAVMSRRAAALAPQTDERGGRGE